MGQHLSRSAKDILVRPIGAKDANRLCSRWHYSKTYVRNSQYHFGVFLDDRCLGVLQFGPPMMKRSIIGLVSGTKWNEMLELNRLAFSDLLPRNSESRALSIAFRFLKNLGFKWVVSFADGTQCGDGAIYRASGFVLTAIKKNTGLLSLPDGSVKCQMTLTKGKHILSGGKAVVPKGSKRLTGFQFRYIYFIDKSFRPRLTVKEIPFSKISDLGAEMYKGKTIKRRKQSNVAPADQVGEGGVIPTPALQSKTNCQATKITS